MNRLKLQLERSNQGLKFSAFIANGEMVAYDEGFTRNGSEGIAALAYLCVCQELHTQSGLKGNCRLIPSDPNCKKLAKALSNKPQWLQNLSSHFPTRRVIENQGVAREPRISLLEDIGVVVEIISSKGQREARYSELQLFKEQCFEKPCVTSLSVEILPCQGGGKKIFQQAQIKDGVFQGDTVWIRGAINCKAHFILIWVDGDGPINVLYPEIFLRIPATIEHGEQISNIVSPSKNGLKISSVVGHEICILFYLSEFPTEKNVNDAVEAIESAMQQTHDIWSLESKFTYSASRNMNSFQCELPTANGFGLTFENEDRNPASALLEHISIDAISARVIIMPNLTS